MASHAPIELGPVPVVDGELVLRPPRYDDHARWREVRLRNERAITRFWPTSDLSWAEQHTEWRWAREVNDHRHEAAVGRGLSFVLELDGSFVGQVTLSGIDTETRTAELGVWCDRAVAHRDVATTAACAVIDLAFDHLGLELVTAPVSTSNVPAVVTAGHIGFTAEATMRGYSHISGTWGDHDLLSVLASERPAGGLLADRLASRQLEARPATVRRARRADHLPSSPACRVALARYTASRIKARLHRGEQAQESDPTFTVTVDGDAVTCGVRDVDPGHSAAEVFVLDPRTPAGAAAAVQHAVDHATRTLGLHRVTAVAAPGDDLRASAYAGAGLRREGTLRSRLCADGTRADLDLWARLDDDPPAS